ncbi:unnamed protein product, partial [Allacma fusca]
MKCTTWSSTR